MTEPVSIAVAAGYLRVSVSTARRWIREGCPCVEPGSDGRGHGARLDLSAVARWRAARRGAEPVGVVDPLPLVEAAVLDVLRRDGGDGRPIWQALGVTAAQASTLFTHLLVRVGRAMKG